MMGHRELTLDDYLSMVRRRLWWIVVPAVVGCAIAFGVSFVLPARYTSQTLVLVEHQKVPEAYVKSVVTDQLNQRLGTMKEQVLSRTRLQPLIERFGLYRDEMGKTPTEDLVDRMRAAISVTPIRPVLTARRQGELPGFSVSFTASSPRIAQQVCTELTSMFMEENLRLREQRAAGTTEFLAKQVEEAKRKLDEQDGKLAEFKRRFIGQLPGQEQTNLSILMGLNTQLDAVTQALNRAQQDKSYLESLLAQQVSAWSTTQSGSNPASLEQQLAALQSSLVALEARYTSDHPDVIKVRGDIAQVQKKLREVGNEKEKTETQKTRATEPAQIQQLRSQVYAADVAIKDKVAEQQRVQQQVKLYQSRVQLSPLVEQQYKELTRDHDTALNFYNELLKKKNESEMSTDLERAQQGEQFRVMDPPNLPEKPSFPNRPLFAAGGLGGGLALGLAVALLFELRDKSVRIERDVDFYLDLPTLARLPTIGEDGRSGGGRARRLGRKDKTAGEVRAEG